MFQWWEKVIVAGVGGLVVLMFVGLMYGTMKHASVSGRCVELGYPRCKLLVDWEGWHGYCVATVNQTDVVVALEKAAQR